MSAQVEVAPRVPFNIELKRYGDDVSVFSVTGEFDLAVAAAAEAALEPAFADPGGLLVVDLTGLEFIDSSGIAMLYALARTRPDLDTLRLVPSRFAGVNRVLDLTAVGSVFPIVPA
jgi:anti-sigma B factor antagonist